MGLVCYIIGCNLLSAVASVKLKPVLFLFRGVLVMALLEENLRCARKRLETALSSQ